WRPPAAVRPGRCPATRRRRKPLPRQAGSDGIINAFFKLLGKAWRHAVCATFLLTCWKCYNITFQSSMIWLILRLKLIGYSCHHQVLEKHLFSLQTNLKERTDDAGI